MTSTPGDDGRRWQQPSWDGPPTADAAADPPPASIEFGEPLSGAVLVPAAPAPPPSLGESTLNVIGGIAWPMAIALAIFGVGGWMLNLALAFVVSATAGAIAGEMKKRRKRR